MKQYCVYIITNKTNTVLYVGFSSNLPKRIYEHEKKLVDGFTKRCNLNKLVYFEQTEDALSALRREKQLKNWKREWKIDLINKNDPEWKDLADALLDSESSSE